MAIDLYKGFTNMITGESFRCISFDEDAFIFEWIVQPFGYIPFEHIHLEQDEIFYVKKGALRIVIEGKEQIAGPGTSITVPKGKRHIAFNDRPEVLECEVRYTPGLDNYAFFQCFGGLTVDRQMNKKGGINIGKMLYFTGKMKARCITRPTSVPVPLFRLAIAFFLVAGSLLGWKKLYTKYTGAAR
ncbi:MAG TPA: cupin domain-containing protein [Flavisolibacter sp.]|nr:cupin domain-containing protein [Flavisolibacter sp.]